jgi:hypothetical protein
LRWGYFTFDSNLTANVTSSLPPGTFINASLPIERHPNSEGTSGSAEVMRRIGTRDSCAIAVRFAVRAHSQEKRVQFRTLFQAARDEKIFAFVPHFFFEPHRYSSDSSSS